MKNGNQNQNYFEEYDFVSLLNALDKYHLEKKNYEFLPEIIEQGLNIFLQHPQIISASLFLMNEDTYEFDHRATFPNSESNTVNDLFNYLVEKEIIGTALNFGKIIISEKNEDFTQSENCLIAPMLGLYGIIGLTILKVNIELIKNNDPIIKILFLFVDIFSAHIENSILNKKLEKTQSLLEQKVAVRTLSLTQSKRELQAILNSVNTGILVVEPETNKILNANLVASQLIGEQQDNIVGKNCLDFFDTMDFENQIIDDKIAFSRNFESFVKKNNGDLIPVLRSITSISLGNQKLRIESFIDITERKKTEIALKKANELLEQKVQDRTEDLQILVHKLKKEVEERKKAEREIRNMLEREKELNEMKSRFVSMVSHEFRTPLTIISSAAQIVERYREKLKDNEINQYLSRIMKTVDLMSNMLENVIFIGKTDVHKEAYSPKPLNLKEFCSSLIQDFELSLNQKREIIFKHDCKVETVNIDEKLCQHILINLLSNALKYSGEDKPIELNIHTDTDQAILIVKDYGIGIPEDELKKVFEQFYRAKNVGAISGTGLGMSVIMRSLEIIDGKIDVTSRINEGSTFKVTIPLQNNIVNSNK